MISKTHISAQKPRGRQLNTKVCGSENAIFLLSFFVQTTLSNNDISKTVQVLTVILSRTDAYHSAELYNHLASS